MRRSRSRCPGEPGGQVLEELVRARIDPVHVLDHQDGGLGLTGAEEHGPQHIERALLELRARKAEEKRLRCRDAQEVGDQGDRLVALDPERLEPLLDEGPYLVAGEPFRETKVPPQELQDRVVGDRGAVGEAGRLELEDARRLRGRGGTRRGGGTCRRRGRPSRARWRRRPCWRGGRPRRGDRSRARARPGASGPAPATPPAGSGPEPRSWPHRPGWARPCP